MSLHIFNNLEQGSGEWHDARRGIITASVVGQFITPKTIKVAANDKTRSMAYQLVAERITGHTEDTYVSYEMEQGHIIEPIARDLYSEHYAPATEVGFMVRDDWGFSIGYSPDGIVGEDGLIEVKKRFAKLHLATILSDEVPPEHMAQCQAGLLVSGRKWLDFISFCGGMPLYVNRVYPDPRWHDAILEAVTAFEESAATMLNAYHAAHKGPMTERLPDITEITF
jgi:predicted phage-related endonuclease